MQVFVTSRQNLDSYMDEAPSVRAGSLFFEKDKSVTTEIQEKGS